MWLIIAHMSNTTHTSVSEVGGVWHALPTAYQCGPLSLEVILFAMMSNVQLEYWLHEAVRCSVYLHTELVPLIVKLFIGYGYIPA